MFVKEWEYKKKRETKSSGVISSPEQAFACSGVYLKLQQRYMLERGIVKMKRNILICLILIAVIIISACSNHDAEAAQVIAVDNTPEVIDTVYDAESTQNNAAHDIELSNELEEELSLGGYHECRHQSSFHSFPWQLLDLIEMEAFYSWLADMRAMDDSISDPTCLTPHVNIVNFVRHFDISREDFQTILDNDPIYYVRHHFGHDLDVLFSGDDALIEQFYTTGHLRRHEVQQYEFMWMLKNSLFYYAESNHPVQLDNWIDSKNTANNWQFSPYNTEFTASIRQWSIPDIIHTFNIPRSFVEQEIHWINNINRLMFTLDFDTIYTPGHMEQLMNVANFSVNLDSDTAQPLAIDPSNIDALVIMPVISPHTLSPEEEQMVILQYIRERMGIQEENRY
jgi:hypothetical protein